jgi:hypothetical protein
MSNHVYIFSCFNKDGSSYWTEKFSLERLALIRKDIGAKDFAEQYENNPISSSDSLFKSEDLKYFVSVPKDTAVETFATLDLGGKGLQDTPTGITVVQVNREDNWYVQHADAVYKDLLDIIEELFRLYNIWKPKMIGVEKEKYSIALMPFLDKEMKRRNIRLPIEQLKLKINDRISKEDRILSLQPRIERGQLFLKKEQTKLVDQIVRFPKGKCDILDALSRITQIAHPPHRNLNRQRANHLDPVFVKCGQTLQNINNQNG